MRLFNNNFIEITVELPWFAHEAIAPHLPGDVFFLTDHSARELCYQIALGHHRFLFSFARNSSRPTVPR